MVSGAKKQGKVGQCRFEGTHRISQSGRDGIGPEIQARFCGAHRIGIQRAHRGDVLDEQAVKPIHLRLQLGLRLIAERVVG